MTSIVIMAIILFMFIRTVKKWKRKIKQKEQEREQKEQDRINYNIAKTIINNNFHMKSREVDNFLASKLYQYFLLAHNHKLEANDELEKNLKHNVKVYIKNKQESSI